MFVDVTLAMIYIHAEIYIQFDQTVNKILQFLITTI